VNIRHEIAGPVAYADRIGEILPVERQDHRYERA